MVYGNDKGALYEQLVSKLEGQIISGELQSGDKLPSENTLAKENNVSRVTVRQALKLLSEMGLIETRKGIGSFVTESDPYLVEGKVKDFMERFRGNFYQAMQVKIIIEPSIAAYAAENCEKADIRKLEELWRLMADAKGNKQYNQLCVEFHLALIGMTKNSLLLEFYRHLEDMERMYLRDLLLPADLHKELRRADIEQHGKILQAIREGRPDMAYLYCKEHLEYVYEHYSEAEGF